MITSVVIVDHYKRFIMSSILNIFASSPIAPLQHHMTTVNTCVQALKPFFKAVLDHDWETVTHYRKTISDFEHEADAIKMHFRTHLPRTWLLPISRFELFDLVARQDGIANLAKDITGLVIGRKTEIPTSVIETFRDFLSTALAATDQANLISQELDNLLESGFKGREVDYIDNLVTKLRELETRNDDVQVTLRSQLFELEASLPPVDVIFFYSIIDKIGELADCAQRVGSRIMMLTAN